jgi:biotin operon repressor
MEKQVYTRITEKLRKNKNLTPLHKLLIGFLNTYQSNPDGTPTNKFYYDKQDNLAEELGVSVRTIKTAIQFLEDKGIIFQPQKSTIDGRPQYKNRKAIILVDKNNPLPSTDNKTLEKETSIEPTQIINVEEIKEKEVKVELEDETERLKEFAAKYNSSRSTFDYYDLLKFSNRFSIENNPSITKPDIYNNGIYDYRNSICEFDVMVKKLDDFITTKQSQTV